MFYFLNHVLDIKVVMDLVSSALYICYISIGYC